MSQEKLQTMSMQNFWGVKEVHYGIVQVVNGMLVHHRVTPSIKFAGTHLYTWVERGTVRVKCLAQEHNTVSPARARTRTARSGVERSNHEAIPAVPRTESDLKIA